jgi:hypothetical protein
MTVSTRWGALQTKVSGVVCSGVLLVVASTDTGSLPSLPTPQGNSGFEAVREQMHRKLLKRGFEFSLIVVGEAGLGKSTLIDTLFCVREVSHELTPKSQFIFTHSQGNVSRRSCIGDEVEPLPSTVEIGSMTHGTRVITQAHTRRSPQPTHQ